MLDANFCDPTPKSEPMTEDEHDDAMARQDEATRTCDSCKNVMGHADELNEQYLCDRCEALERAIAEGDRLADEEIVRA